VRTTFDKYFVDHGGSPPIPLTFFKVTFLVWCALSQNIAETCFASECKSAIQISTAVANLIKECVRKSAYNQYVSSSSLYVMDHILDIVSSVKSPSNDKRLKFSFERESVPCYDALTALLNVKATIPAKFFAKLKENMMAKQTAEVIADVRAMIDVATKTDARSGRSPSTVPHAQNATAAGSGMDGLHKVTQFRAEPITNITIAHF
jgi:hypothetical protein